MDFEQRIRRAIDHGKQTLASEQSSLSKQQATEEDMKAVHSAARLEMTEHIENCLKKLTDYFPGFEFETVIDEAGWGARIRRDNIELNRGVSERHYSHLEMLIRPFSSAQLIDLSAKATIRNKELFARSHFQRLAERDLDSFSNLIDLWILEFVEAYSSQK